MGLKGKLASLEDFISMQNEELAAQRQEIESLRNDKQNIEQHYQAQLQELKKTMVADVQRMQEEVKRHFAHQKAENSRLQQQITTLKGEKTSLQQQILGLQRRIQEIEEHRQRLGSRSSSPCILNSSALKAPRATARRRRLFFFSIIPAFFPMGQRRGPVFWNDCPVAQLQGGVPNLGGFRVFVSCTFCWQPSDRGSTRHTDSEEY